MAGSRHTLPKWRERDRRGGNAPQSDGLNRSQSDAMALWYDLYLEHLAVKNFSVCTIENRRKSLLAFLKWCQDRDLYRPQEITRPILEAYQRSLYRHRKTNGKPLGFATQRGHLTALKDYFRWLCRQNVLLSNPASELELPQQERRLPQGTLSEGEMERILAQPDITQILGIRDRAILETLYSTGIRRAELTHLRLCDVHQEQAVLFIRRGKGKKDRVVPIGQRALAWINQYCEEARPSLLTDPREDTLFLSGFGDSALNIDYLGRLVTGYLRLAGIKEGGCHVFRHSCATLMLENGADIRFIQQLLGHACLSSTQIYTEVSIKQLQRVHSMTHPAERQRDAGP